MDIQALKQEQTTRAAEVVRADDFDVMPPRYIAGADVGLSRAARSRAPRWCCWSIRR